MPLFPIGTMVAVFLVGWYALTSGLDDEMVISRTRKWAVIIPLFAIYILLLLATWGGLLWVGLQMEDELTATVPPNPWLIVVGLVLLVSLPSIPAILLLRVVATRAYVRFLIAPPAPYVPWSYPPIANWVVHRPRPYCSLLFPRSWRETQRTENSITYSCSDLFCPSVYLQESPAFDGSLVDLESHAANYILTLRGNPGFELLYMAQVSGNVARSVCIYEEDDNYAGAVLDTLHVQTPDVFLDILVQQRWEGSEYHDAEFARLVFLGFMLMRESVVVDSQLIRAAVQVA